MKKITGKCVEIRCGPFYKIPEGYDDVTIRVAHKSMHDTTIGTEVEICYEEPKQFYGVKTTICKAKSLQKCSKFSPDENGYVCKYWVSRECHYKD